MAEPVCDIVLLVWNHLEETAACLEALRRTTTLPCRLLIVDNGSESPTREWLEQVRGSESMTVELLRNPSNLGSPGGFNRGLRASTARYVCLLSNDVQPASGWLEELIKVAESDSRIGIVGPSSNTCGQKVPPGMTVEQLATALRQTQRGWSEMAYGEFFCMLITREVTTRIGYIDETFGLAYFDDTDYCRRTQEAGMLCVRARAAYVYHQEGRSLKDTWQHNRKRQENFDLAASRFFEKWGRPKRVAYFIAHPARLDMAGLAPGLRARLRAFDRVWFFMPSDRNGLALPEHDSLLPVRLPAPVFLPAALWKVLTKKKRFEQIVTDDRWLGAMLRALRPIHQGEVSTLGT